jgi:hypothetical protein
VSKAKYSTLGKARNISFWSETLEGISHFGVERRTILK